MDICIMQYNYRNKYLVAIDGDVYVYKYDKYKFGPPFLSFKPKQIFIGRSKVCDMTEFSGAADHYSDFEANTFLLEVEDRKYVYISGIENTDFKLATKL